MDPLQFYRKATLYKPIFDKNQRRQNPGLVKNYDYNSVIIGTSMTEGMNPYIVDSSFDCKAIKLSISGATMHEQRLVLEMALKTQKVKKVFWGIDTHSFRQEYLKVREQSLSKFPGYLYDDILINDLQYLLDNQTFKSSIGFLRKHEHNRYKSYRDFNIEEDTLSRGRDAVISFWQNENNQKEVKKFIGVDDNQSEEIGIKNIQYNLFALVKAFPNIEFYFYFTPTSILEHVEQNKNGSLDKNLNLKKMIVNTLSDNPNIHFFDFQSIQKITHNLDNYKDFMHYIPRVNNFIIHSMKKNNYICTRINIDSSNQQIKEQVAVFSLEKLRHYKHGQLD